MEQTAAAAQVGWRGFRAGRPTRRRARSVRRFEMRFLFLLFSILFFPATAAYAEVNVGVLVSTPGVTLGINIPSYPRLVRIPGYPVFYDPYVSVNYFFYDGVYWVFYDD